ncbi:hypothetical protein CAPTEDRAFT_151990 [Capitella teleta]|uniref:AB hydrolase-1 domain-containing protein n=1 Tax=Capitella teleta TaxID=283909 RepID=R7UI78_CAPTE|nr:hypothetical protein CAPTEDRAFT_151990 [Capitella teleta]|eukprot:ELU03488.1 hypothetical protein CAPTEDRAFT_151990 [Capitella teleta]
MLPGIRKIALFPKEGHQAFFAILPRFASSSTEAKPERLSRNLSFREAYDSPLPSHERPLVMLYGWLVAKSKHIHKYGDFYLGKGFDVLHIKIEPLQLMWPETSQKVIKQLVDFVDNRGSQPLLVHGFSVGGYLYGETLVKIDEDPRMRKEVGSRIVGQIFDSPVDYEGIPRGFSRAVSPVPVVQRSLEATISAYMRLFPKKVVSHYHASSAMFHENPFRTPALVLNSEADLIGTPEPIQVVVDKWRSKGIPVDMKTWAETPHVSHFHYHPVQYIKCLSGFLSKIGLINDKTEMKEKIGMHG